MASFLQRLSGNLFLAYRAVFAHPLRKAFRLDERSGLDQFLGNYAAEGLLPTDPAERRMREGASRCIACGLCDRYGARLSLLPLSYARSMPELKHAASLLAAIPPHALDKGEAVCPTRVPLRAIAEQLRTGVALLQADKG